MSPSNDREEDRWDDEEKERIKVVSKAGGSRMEAKVGKELLTPRSDMSLKVVGYGSVDLVA